MRCPFKRIGLCDSTCAIWISTEDGAGICSLKAIPIHLYGIQSVLQQIELVDSDEITDDDGVNNNQIK